MFKAKLKIKFIKPLFKQNKIYSDMDFSNRTLMNTE